MALHSNSVTEKKFPKVRLQTWLLAGGTLFGVLAFGVIALVYLMPSTVPHVASLRSRLPLPVAVVGYQGMVSFRELEENTAAVRRFYESQDFSQIGLRVDFSTEEGKRRLKVREKEILNKMLEDRTIQVLAEERGIRVTEEMARSGLLRALEEYGSEVEVRENLSRLYGWTLDDFQKKIVLPGLYEEKLNERFQEEVDTRTAARGRIEAAEKALLQEKSFTETAQEFSEGETAQQGGALGWFGLSELTPELQSAVSSQSVGRPGDIVESNLGFHMVLVNETKKENGEDLYRLSQIFVRKSLFTDWLTEQMRTMGISVWSPDYRYNAEEAQVEFQAQEMRDFQARILEEENGDAVFTF